ncbi:cytochrome P450 [Micromonospora sp. LH3U1]|uniref:cytochrome P450 n=1 Tax=Micromonospora sp. LH3U1 TaxID=3018339 RepID=UPI00234A6032|nr:cytochrome P450 [Micromonospora sp. LH3U1]WCN79584.1 cytochrome P450 [Micromonospora sp. LH3U1]
MTESAQTTESRTVPPARPYPFSVPDRLVVDPTYGELRENEPMTRVKLPYGEEAWLATRYEDVRTVLGDVRFGRAPAVQRDEPRLTPRQQYTGMLTMDPPDHTRLRRLVAKAFTARRVEALRPRTQEIADALVDDMVRLGPPADLVEHVATPLPIQVICELLGVPYADRDRFHTWSEAIVSTTSLPLEMIQEYLNNLWGYIGDLVAERRREPGIDDLLGALVRARDENEDRLSETELVELAGGLLAAGHETTVTQIPNFIYVLLHNPDQLARLRADPSLVPAAVEELLRYVPLGVGSSFARYAKEDVEVGGVLVRAGEPVLGSLSSANRDGTVFADPDRLDLEREQNPHLGFGHGVHHCVGAQLARMELQVAVATLVTRLPGLRLAVPEAELEWKRGMLVRGLLGMPVAW